MSKNYAQTYIGIGHRLYAPGEEIECLDDAQWKRLLEAGAIRCEYDPVEAAMEEGEEENAKTSSHSSDGEETGESLNEAETEEPEDEEPMPEIDVMDGIADEEPATPKKKSAGRKRA